MTPLRIDFELVGPISRPANPIHLDSLIANRLVMRDLPSDAPIADIRSAIENLPLKRKEIGGDWVWAASSIAFDWISPPMQQFAVRAIRQHDVAAKLTAGLISNMRPDTKIHTGRGRLKSATYHYETQWARRAVAFCIGNPAEISSLLHNLDQLGARRRLGQGRVTKVEVTEDERALTLWQRRNLPSGADVGRLAEGAYRLPLFDPVHRTVVRTNPLEFDRISG